MLEAQIALLDEVEEVHALGERVTTGNGDHEAEVGPDETVFGLGGLADRALQLDTLLASLDASGGVAACLDRP